jgi:hypothetical protein
LGLGLWGFGLLCHYEACLIALVLALPYLEKHPLSRWRWRTVRPLLIAGGLVAFVLAAYYVPFMSHPHFGETFRRYTEIRISPDRMPYNNLTDYLTSSLFYNSVYYEVVMTAGFLIAAWVALRQAFNLGPVATDGHVTRGGQGGSRIVWPGLFWLLLAVGLVGAAVAPGLLQIGGFHLPLLLVLPALAVLAFSGRIAVGLRMCFLWFGAYLVAYAFLIRVPGLHYYALLPAWCLLAAWGIGQVAGQFARSSPTWRWAGACAAVVLSALLLYHPYLLFLRTNPEYALSYPRHRNLLYWNTSDGRPSRFFGLPHRSGWKAIGYLFDEGVLDGEYRSNENEEIVTWYTGGAPSQADRPVYYLIADNATAKEHEQDYPVELLASAYSEIGRVLVSGESRLRIYHVSPAQGNLGPYRDEELAPLYDHVTGLANAQGEQP